MHIKHHEVILSWKCGFCMNKAVYLNVFEKKRANKIQRFHHLYRTRISSSVEWVVNACFREHVISANWSKAAIDTACETFFKKPNKSMPLRLYKIVMSKSLWSHTVTGLRKLPSSGVCMDIGRNGQFILVLGNMLYQFSPISQKQLLTPLLRPFGDLNMSMSLRLPKIFTVVKPKSLRSHTVTGLHKLLSSGFCIDLGKNGQLIPVLGNMLSQFSPLGQKQLLAPVVRHSLKIWTCLCLSDYPRFFNIVKSNSLWLHKPPSSEVWIDSRASGYRE